MSNFENFGTVDTFDFNSPMTAEETKEFILLEEGEYPFTVGAVDKMQYEPTPNSKIPPCKKAVVHCNILTPNGNKIIKYDMFYYVKMKWKIDDMFIGVGLAKENESYTPDPNNLIGKSGTCLVKIREYKKQDGTTGQVNEINKIFRSRKEINKPQDTIEPATTYGGF